MSNTRGSHNDSIALGKLPPSSTVVGTSTLADERHGGAADLPLGIDVVISIVTTGKLGPTVG